MKFIQWLKSLFTKKESEDMSDQSVTDTTEATTTPVATETPAAAEASATTDATAATDAPAVSTETATTSTEATDQSPLEQAKAKFDAFVEFVEHGLEVLGKDAEADLVALKDKFL